MDTYIAIQYKMQFNFPNPPERNPMSQWRKHWACYLCSAGCFRFLINKCYLYSTCCFTFFISKCRVKSWNSQIKLREAPILQRPLTGNISKVTSAKCNIWRFLCQSLEQSNFFTLKYNNNNLHGDDHCMPGIQTSNGLESVYLWTISCDW